MYVYIYICISVHREVAISYSDYSDHNYTWSNMTFCGKSPALDRGFRAVGAWNQDLRSGAIYGLENDGKTDEKRMEKDGTGI